MPLALEDVPTLLTLWFMMIMEIVLHCFGRYQPWLRVIQTRSDIQFVSKFNVHPAKQRESGAPNWSLHCIWELRPNYVCQMSFEDTFYHGVSDGWLWTLNLVLLFGNGSFWLANGWQRIKKQIQSQSACHLQDEWILEVSDIRFVAQWNHPMLMSTILIVHAYSRHIIDASVREQIFLLYWALLHSPCPLLFLIHDRIHSIIPFTFYLHCINWKTIEMLLPLIWLLLCCYRIAVDAINASY